MFSLEPKDQTLILVSSWTERMKRLSLLRLPMNHAGLLEMFKGEMEVHLNELYQRGLLNLQGLSRSSFNRAAKELRVECLEYDSLSIQLGGVINSLGLPKYSEPIGCTLRGIRPKAETEESKGRFVDIGVDVGEETKD